MDLIVETTLLILLQFGYFSYADPFPLRITLKHGKTCKTCTTPETPTLGGIIKFLSQCVLSVIDFKVYL